MNPQRRMPADALRGAAAPRRCRVPRLRAPAHLWSQLVFGTVSIVIATSAAFAVLLSLFFGHYFATARVSALTARARTVGSLWSHPPQRALPQIAALVRDTGGHCWVLAADGGTLAQFGSSEMAGGLALLTSLQETALLHGRPVDLVSTRVAGQGGRTAVVGVPLGQPARDGGAAVVWAAPVRGRDILRAVAARLAVVAGSGLLLAVALAAWLASFITRPIRRLEVAAGQIAAGRFPAEPGAEGPVEVRSLARSLGHMTARLADLDTQRRAFLADVSHELRTPLAAVRGALEGIRSTAAGNDAPSLQYLDTAIHETARMSRLVDDLLALARAQAGRLVLHRRPVDMAEETARVALSLEPVASRRGVGFRFEVPEAPVLVDADPDRLSQVLWNLLDNAARHTPGGCEASVRMAPVAGQAVLRLQNPGAVWSTQDAAALFERFERRDTEGSAGLGLAISRTLARAHGGDLEAEPLPEGGLAVTLRWPLAAARRPADRPARAGEGHPLQA